MPRKRSPAHLSPAAVMPPGTGPVHGEPRVIVTFAQAHTHRGVGFGKGDTYAATPAERELLLHFDVIERD